MCGSPTGSSTHIHRTRTLCRDTRKGPRVCRFVDSWTCGYRTRTILSGYPEETIRTRVRPVRWSVGKGVGLIDGIPGLVSFGLGFNRLVIHVCVQVLESLSGRSGWNSFDVLVTVFERVESSIPVSVCSDRT